MNNPAHISWSSGKPFFWLKILKFFDADPGLKKSDPGWKKVGSATQLVPTLDGDGDDEDADGGADEGAGVAHRQQALALDKLRHLGGEVAQVRLHVVLQN